MNKYLQDYLAWYAGNGTPPVELWEGDIRLGPASQTTITPPSFTGADTDLLFGMSQNLWVVEKVYNGNTGLFFRDARCTRYDRSGNQLAGPAPTILGEREPICVDKNDALLLFGRDSPSSRVYVAIVTDTAAVTFDSDFPYWDEFFGAETQEGFAHFATTTGLLRWLNYDGTTAWQVDIGALMTNGMGDGYQGQQLMNVRVDPDTGDVILMLRDEVDYTVGQYFRVEQGGNVAVNRSYSNNDRLVICCRQFALFEGATNGTYELIDMDTGDVVEPASTALSGLGFDHNWSAGVDQPFANWFESFVDNIYIVEGQPSGVSQHYHYTFRVLDIHEGTVTELDSPTTIESYKSLWHPTMVPTLGVNRFGRRRMPNANAGFHVTESSGTEPNLVWTGEGWVPETDAFPNTYYMDGWAAPILDPNSVVIPAFWTSYVNTEEIK